MPADKKKSLFDLMDEAGSFERGVVAWDDAGPPVTSASERCARHLLGALPGEDAGKASLRRVRLAKRLDELVAAERRRPTAADDRECG
ncbi:MAG: hypothetical protein H6705_21325 [Myxococcales bacterium]|nr:hypothetical protein [Myxococcales bacterium]